MTNDDILRIAKATKLSDWIRVDDAERFETVRRFASMLLREAHQNQLKTAKPAAEVVGNYGSLGVIKYLDESARRPMRRPLFTKPTHDQWQDLTQEEVNACWFDALGFYREHKAATREIMKLLKEKNT